MPDSRPVLIASKNPGKILEFSHLFSPLNYHVKSLLDFPNLPDIKETGNTFKENARLKAETLAILTGQVAIGDDSGLCIDSLDGLPGIYSHRYSAPHPTDQKNIKKVLDEMKGLGSDPDKRKARFHTALVAARPDFPSLVVEADWFGTIATEPQGTGGFGYDPIFLVGDGRLSAAQLPLDQKNKESHRAQALKKLLKELPLWLKS